MKLGSDLVSFILGLGFRVWILNIFFHYYYSLSCEDAKRPSKPIHEDAKRPSKPIREDAKRPSDQDHKSPFIFFTVTIKKKCPFLTCHPQKMPRNKIYPNLNYKIITLLSSFIKHIYIYFLYHFVNW